jgi:calcineurin-like phosphoesterase family protein
VSGRRRLATLALVVFGSLLLAAGSPSVSRGSTVRADAAGDPVIAAVGDMACDPSDVNYNGGLGVGNKCRQQATSDLAAAGGYAAVLALGDEQYECGGYQAFLQAYDPTWGRVRAITRPTPGNHEYLQSNNSAGTGCGSLATARGYFDYFGSAAGTKGKGYYSFDIGSWHLIALNANCRFTTGCKAGSAQEKWLKADLAASSATCTLAFWHQPRFSSAKVHGNNDKYAAFWDDLYAAGADLVLNGHFHAYERFAPQDPNQQPDPTTGIREIVVGTGGEGYQQFGAVQPNSEVRGTKLNGILAVTLHPDGYDWEYVAIPGETFSEAGSDLCH